MNPSPVVTSYLSIIGIHPVSAVDDDEHFLTVSHVIEFEVPSGIISSTNAFYSAVSSNLSPELVPVVEVVLAPDVAVPCLSKWVETGEDRIPLGL